MNKNDFLEILKDYLKGHFSEHEISDIIRDYEEFFLNGELQGKKEEEISNSLGSPKVIAKDIIYEIKGKSDSNIEKGSHKKFQGIKNTGKKVRGICKGFLSSRDIISGKFSALRVKALIILLTIIMLPFALTVLAALVACFIGLFTVSISAAVGIVYGVLLMSYETYAGIFIFFLCLISIGILIAIWTILINVVIGLKKVVLLYISWIKTRFMYIKMKNKKVVLKGEGEGNE